MNVRNPRSISSRSFSAISRRSMNCAPSNPSAPRKQTTHSCLKRRSSPPVHAPPVPQEAEPGVDRLQFQREGFSVSTAVVPSKLEASPSISGRCTHKPKGSQTQKKHLTRVLRTTSHTRRLKLSSSLIPSTILLDRFQNSGGRCRIRHCTGESVHLSGVWIRSKVHYIHTAIMRSVAFYFTLCTYMTTFTLLFFFT